MSMFAILIMNKFEGRSGFCDNLADSQSLYGINDYPVSPN
jgi:hypothetical protein